MPGAVVVPPVAGVEPELPGAVVVPPVVASGTVTTADLTGVVATVTNLADFFTAAGVTFVVTAWLDELPPPGEPPPELAVQIAYKVVAA